LEEAGRPSLDARSESITVALVILSLSGLEREGKSGGVWLGPLCSRNPHDKTVVVRRAQMVTKPGHRVYYTSMDARWWFC
jgi:hypothetical protein